MKKILLPVLTALLLFGLIPISACTSDNVSFPDPYFEEIIRKALDKPEGVIYTWELEDIITLSSANEETTGLDSGLGMIDDLTGIEYCTNLLNLDLSGNQLADISPLETLTGLRSLNLSNNRISDISPLKSLTILESLDLSQNTLGDITPLTYLTNLSSLDPNNRKPKIFRFFQL